MAENDENSRFPYENAILPGKMRFLPLFALERLKMQHIIAS